MPILKGCHIKERNFKRTCKLISCMDVITLICNKFFIECFFFIITMIFRTDGLMKVRFLL